jgi:hypothetical protein
MQISIRNLTLRLLHQRNPVHDEKLYHLVVVLQCNKFHILIYVRISPLSISTTQAEQLGQEMAGSGQFR